MTLRDDDEVLVAVSQDAYKRNILEVEVYRQIAGHRVRVETVMWLMKGEK